MNSLLDHLSFLHLALAAAVIGFVANRLKKPSQGSKPLLGGKAQAPIAPLRSIEERLARKRSWARGEIRSKGILLAAVFWFVALIWGLTFGVSFFNHVSNPEMKIGAKIVLGIFACGIVPIIGFAIYFTKRYLRFGESVCRISGKAGILGQKISGTITTKTEINPEGDYTVSLECIESYHSGTGNQRTQKSVMHWKGTQNVARAGVRSVAGIPFSIDLPPHPPESGDKGRHGLISWQLHIKAPTKGVDYAALFVVPVFKVN